MRGGKGAALLVAGSALGSVPEAATADSVPDGDLAYARLFVSVELLALDFYGRAIASKHFDKGQLTDLRRARADEKQHYDSAAAFLSPPDRFRQRRPTSTSPTLAARSCRGVRSPGSGPTRVDRSRRLPRRGGGLRVESFEAARRESGRERGAASQRLRGGGRRATDRGRVSAPSLDRSRLRTRWTPTRADGGASDADSSTPPVKLRRHSESASTRCAAGIARDGSRPRATAAIGGSSPPPRSTGYVASRRMPT